MGNSYEDTNKAIGIYGGTNNQQHSKNRNIKALQKCFKSMKLTHETTFFEAQLKLWKFTTFLNGLETIYCRDLFFFAFENYHFWSEKAFIPLTPPLVSSKFITFLNSLYAILYINPCYHV